MPGFVVSLELTDWLTNTLQRATCLCATMLELRIPATTPGFCVGAVNLNSGPYVCATGTLQTQTFLQSQNILSKYGRSLERKKTFFNDLKSQKKNSNEHSTCDF